jgi:outer membrane protein assembly factor BamD
MPNPSARALAALRLLSLVLCLLAASAARADLTWTPQTGWRIEGGVLSGLAGNEGRNALDLMNQARTAEEAGRLGSAISSYAKVTKKYPNSVYAAEALFRTAQLRLRRKQYFKSFTAYQDILDRYPNTGRFDQIIGEQYRIASALLEGARNRIWGEIPGFTHREKAVEYFEKILTNAPYSEYAPLALMSAARGHQQMGSNEEAIDALDRMINIYPQSVLAPDAYLKLAQAHAGLVEGPYYDQTSTREAITYFEDFMILYPGDKNVGEAEKGRTAMKKVLAESKMKMADFYFFRRDNYAAAKVFYNEAITAYPDSAIAQKARERLAEVEVKAAKSKLPHRRKFLGLF